MKPLFTIITDPLYLLDLFLLERKPFKLGIFGCIQLWQCMNPIVNQCIAEIVDMISHADLFNLVDFIAKAKLYNILANSKALSMHYLNSLFWNVHPSAIFTIKINHIEVFKPVKL